MPSSVLDAKDTTGKAKERKVPAFTHCLYINNHDWLYLWMQGRPIYTNLQNQHGVIKHRFSDKQIHQRKIMKSAYTSNE